MRHLVLVGLVIATSTAAIAYVYVSPNAGRCGNCPVPATELLAPAATPCEETICLKCQSNVVDVVDLNTAYPITTQTPGSTISFDEPPYAKPKVGDVIPTQFEMPAVELAPAPREATEQAPPPRIVK